MLTRRLGRSDLRVSILGIGSSPFRYGTVSDCGALLTQALDAGITYYDTARSYVNGEGAVAELSPGDRNRLIVATKTGARFGQACLTDLQTSLATMRRNHVDVWMTHMVRNDGSTTRAPRSVGSAISPWQRSRPGSSARSAPRFTLRRI
jgi:aryl-alcohol dehydrogenase-like predicted oxidoreductase